MKNGRHQLQLEKITCQWTTRRLVNIHKLLRNLVCKSSELKSNEKKSFVCASRESDEIKAITAAVYIMNNKTFTTETWGT